MGNPHSTPEKQVEDRSAHVAHYKRLYQELTATDDSGAAPDDQMFKDVTGQWGVVRTPRKFLRTVAEKHTILYLRRTRFENYFGGPYLELGQLLHHKLFGSLLPVDEEMFVSSMAVLERLSAKRGEHHEAENFYFSVFSEGKEAIDRQCMTKILHAAATIAIVVGSELHEGAVLPKDHTILTSFTNAAMSNADKTTGLLHTMQFAVWVSHHCPLLLEGIRHWVLSLLHEHPQEKIGETEQAAATGTADTPVVMCYQLPSPALEGEELLARELELDTTIWALSTVLPLPYMGHKAQGKKLEQDYPIGGTWTLLYSSNQHGFSMNRFQHHCSDYREPSVMLLSCYHSNEDQQYTFAVAMDTEWRDGTYYWGGENFTFVQLRPSFGLLKSGPKLLSLNERQRGFPTGLRVMASDKHDSCLLEVDSSLEKARFRDGGEMVVKQVEVWGCGGVEAMESQRRVKKWEEGEILRRRKVKTKDLKETWQDSPDRLLLEMGGVTTQRPTEQQQQ